MKELKKQFVRIWLPIIMIVAVVTVAYMLIYAHNPFSEIGSVLKGSFTDTMNKQAIELEGITQWFNTEPLTLEELKGKVVLLEFWTFGCINCQRTLPYLVEWDKKYRDQGLVILGVHTPEFRFEKDPDNVAAAIEEYGIEYPVALDNEYATWRAWGTRYWPTKYLIDVNGMVVYKRIGEGAYDITEQKIQELLQDVSP